MLLCLVLLSKTFQRRRIAGPDAQREPESTEARFEEKLCFGGVLCVLLLPTSASRAGLWRCGRGSPGRRRKGAASEGHCKPSQLDDLCQQCRQV